MAQANPSARIGIYGWGVVAPRSADIYSFAGNLSRTETWMQPFSGFGPSNFLVGEPEFELESLRPWVEQRFKPARFNQFVKHSGNPVRYAVKAFTQALEQNPGIEQLLQDLAGDAHVYIGTGVGDLTTAYDTGVAYYKAQRRWNRFWGNAEHCALRAQFEQSSAETAAALVAEYAIPNDPATIEDPDDRDNAAEVWEQFWCAQSEQLLQYLAAAREIQSVPVSSANGGKASVIKNKRVAMKKLNQQWGCPVEPWAAVDPNLIWNIHNSPAAQVSMLGKITGPAIAPVGACASFGVALKLAQNAIRQGEAKAVVVGMTDPAPHPLLVGAFYKANVLSGDGEASKPLQGMKGTHIAGGACVWVVADVETMEQHGFKPVGMEIVGIGLSSDADHIITPSAEGPLASANAALAQAEIAPEQLSSWDMHCTATPGDESEVAMIRSLLPDIPMTARKGSFGHGMSVGGAWELTAQHLGASFGELAPTVLRKTELSEDIAELHRNFVFDQPLELDGDYHGKINMGVGGINACVISKRWQ